MSLANKARPAKEICNVNAHVRSGVTPPLHTPTAWSPLVGREQDLETLERLVPQQRLVTLWGPGGSGKTRLAMQVAQSLEDAFADGCRVVDCANLNEPRPLIQHVRSTLVHHLVGERAPLEALIKWLRARHLLLVLDNGEHVLDGCAELVDALLAACPHLHVLVTSRELLNLPGEQAYQVQPLTLPPDNLACHAAGPGRGAEREDWEAVGAYAAIQLFVQRVRMAQTDFALTRENASLVVTICRLLDGLPLAIELAAARVRLLALEQLAERLGQGIAILGAGSRLAPPRQQTLQATMAWSYQLLTPSEQQLFRRLAAASCSFDLSLVEALGEGIGDAASDAVDLLAHLIDKSLVSVVTLRGGARYRLLDTIHHYGREQLQASDETVAAYRLYSGWARWLAEQAESGLQGPDQAAWLRRLDADIEHVRAAIRWFLDHRDTVAVIDMAAALTPFCEQRAHAHEAIEWLRAALAGAEALAPESEAKALHALGVLTIRCYRTVHEQDYLTQAQDDLTRARDRYTELNDQAGVASAWSHLGYIHFWRADYRAAKSCLESGLAIAPNEALNVRAGLLHRLAITVCELGGRTERVRLLKKSLRLRRQAGDVRGLALTLAILGSALAQQEDYAQAQRLLRESLRLFDGLGDRDGYLVALINLYQVALALKDPRLTQEYLAVALSSTWVECELWLLVDLFDCLGRMALVQRRPLQATQLFGWRAALRNERSDELPESLQTQLRRLTPEAPRPLRGQSETRSWLESYTTAWRDGQLMGLDEAFACALDAARLDAARLDAARLDAARRRRSAWRRSAWRRSAWRRGAAGP